MPQFINLAALPEDEKIKAIGEAAMMGQVCSFFVEYNTATVTRYVNKLGRLFPKLQIKRLGTVATSPGVYFVKVWLPEEEAK